MIKIRYKTWYWGKWVYSGTNLDGSIVTEKSNGFELYDELKHGIHSEEKNSE